MSIHKLFYPKGVVVAGSASPGKLGQVLLERLLNAGFPSVFALNPKAIGWGAAPGFISARQIEAPLDLAVIVSPAATVADVLADCGEAGVRAAIIISSGFSEAGNAEGERQLQEVAARYGISYTGPNCAGLINTGNNLLASLEAAPPPGATSLISQSGAVGGVMMDLAHSRGLGLAKFVSYGNGSGVNELDLLAYLADDQKTKVIAMYLENIKQGREFLALLRLVTAKKPVVVVKSGRTGSGQRATLSHTGALAGSDQVYDAALAQAGAIRVAGIEDMIDLCLAFSLPPMNSKKLAIITNSGGPAVLTADRADELGLKVAEPSLDCRLELASFLPPHAGLANPIDLTVEGDAAAYKRALLACLRENGAAIALYVGTPYLPAMPIAQAIAEAAAESGKPVATILQVGADIEEAQKYLLEANLPLFLSGERAVQALAYLARYQELKTAAAEPLPPKGKIGPGALLEQKAMELLQKSGMPTPPLALVKSPEEAIVAGAKLAYPLVAKVVSPEILHKSGQGGVILNIKDAAQLTEAFRRLIQLPGALGVLLYPMLKGDFELILGLSRDRQFGPVVVCGLGGIYTEILRDVALRIAPVSREEAETMLRQLRAYPILSGARGKQPLDLEALARLISNFSQLPFLYPDLEEADINPLFVSGAEFIAVDARIIGMK